MNPPNRLIREKSPYLLQHAHNPVDWYPWGEEAFKKAAAENKPVILSIGYSTCHWCHVMEHESFEKEDAAALMNERFISIKVDREERPDLDALYMSFVTATTGSGGWPMTVFLTPDQKPFYGGTYFPPEDRYGRPGFKTLLTSIADAWKSRRGEILSSAESSAAFLQNQPPGRVEAVFGLDLTEETLEDAFSYHEAAHDASYGGFGGAPKFPRPHALTFLMRYARRTKNSRPSQLVESTLKALSHGGIYDQLGGGFHRYSTDAQWRVPHFEKMLYDQALLIQAYAEAYQMSPRPEYERIARETADYVLRELTDSLGGFYSAQDADSADPDHGGEKREGAFFVWSLSEIERLLGDAAKEFCLCYGVTAQGNAISDPQGEFAGKNVLYRAMTEQEAAQALAMTTEAVEASLTNSRQKLRTERNRRPKPHLDDKVLTDWNALMIASLSLAARVFEEPRYRDAAERAARFILTHLQETTGKLLHRYRDGQSALAAHLNDYAFFIQALIELYQTTFHADYLVTAKKLTDRMIELFWDESSRGFFLTAADAEPLIARPKEIYDGAIPAAHSVAVLNLLKLSRFTGNEKYASLARQALKASAQVVSQGPANYTQLLCALDFELGPSYEVVISADREAAVAKNLLRAIDKLFIPNRIVVWNDPISAGSLSQVVSPLLVKGRGPVDGKPAVYVCRDFSCGLPVTEVKDLETVFK